MDIVAYFLCYSLEIKDKPRTWCNKSSKGIIHLTLPTLEQHGLCRALSYIIQTLSAETAFGYRLTFPLKAQHIPTKWNVGGTAADFMINVRYVLQI